MNFGSIPGRGVGAPQIWYGGGALALGHITHFGAYDRRGLVRFRVACPDSRLRVKVSLLFVRDNGDNSLPVTDHLATLWLGEEEQDRSGKTGGFSACTDILRTPAGVVVHQSAPLAIPEDVALEGFSQEFVTAADAILGIFESGQHGPSGQWGLQLRYQPDGQRLCDDEWEQLTGQCHANILGPAFMLTDAE